MPYKPLQLGSATASSEAIQQSLRKINEMLAELYATDPTLFDWNNFDQSIIPATTDSRDLGSPTKRWRSIYVSGNSLHIGDTVLSVDQTGKLLIDGASISGDYNDLDNLPVLSLVATSGNYNDLTNKPIIPNLTGYATENFVTTRGYITASSLTGYATETYVNDQITTVVGSAPAALNTLAELAAALNNDQDYAATITSQLSLKANISSLATVATSGSYNDLTDRPSLFSGSYNDLTDTPNLSQYLTTETDPTVGSHIKSITTQNISNWDSAYGWGDHALAGYLTSYTETDPTVPNHVKAISTESITNWNIAYGWGNHATAGYISGYIETDPVFTSSVAAGISSTNILNWDTAYGWGDHSLGGYLTTASSIGSLSDVDVTTNPPEINQVLKWNGTKWIPAVDVTTGGSGLDADTLDGQHGSFYLDYNNFTNTPDLSGFLTEETSHADVIVDGDFASQGIMLRGATPGSYSILTDNSTNWNTAYGWGDHALAGYAISSTLSTIATSGSYNDLTDKPTLFSGSYTDLTDKPAIPADISDLTDINNLLGTASTGNVTFTGNTINVSNANPLTITPVVTLSSDLNATNITLTGTITSQASGTPEIVSDNEILLDAGTRVELVGSPIKMANLTTAERDAILAENGDMIYNTSTNKFQGYANGVWVDLH